MTKKTVFRDLSGSALLKSEDRFDRAGGASFVSKWEKNHPKFGEGKFSELIRQLRPARCRKCGSRNIRLVQSNGVSLPRWLCLDEGVTFNVLSGTIFEGAKLPFDEWLEFLMSIGGMSSFGIAALTGKHAWKTIKYWMAKAFVILRDYQKSIVLGGKVWVDETVIALSSRFQKRDSDGKRLRGNSKNNLNIAVATDGVNVIARVVSLGMADENRIFEALSTHITPGSAIFHDNAVNHGRLVRELGLESVVHPSAKTRNLPASADPLEKINHIHYLLKVFLKAHGRFRRDELQGYLDLFTFLMNPPEGRWTKACRLIEMGMKTLVVKRYADYFQRLSDPDDHAVPEEFKQEYDSWMKKM